jgi:hypothetical protein
MNIKTKYQTNSKGTGQVIAKARGKQRTIPYDHGMNLPRNHGVAAATIARALGVTDYNIVHITINNTTAEFVLEEK